MEKTKITKKMVLLAMESYFAGMDEATDIEGVTVADILEYTNKTLEQIDKKAAKAAETRKAKAAEADEVTGKIFELITDEYQTADAILDQLDAEDMTIGKVRARLSKLVQMEKITKTSIKVDKSKKVAYALPGADADDDDINE